MKKVRNIMFITLILLLTCLLVACGEKNVNSNNGEDNNIENIDKESKKEDITLLTPVQLTEENQSTEVDYMPREDGQCKYSKKIIEYSLNYIFENNTPTTIYFGHLEGRDILNDEDITANFIQYNDEIVKLYDAVGLDDDIDGDWKVALSLVDLESNDNYTELAVRTYFVPAGAYESLEIYRVVDGNLKSMGKTQTPNICKKNGRLCDDSSYLSVISEDLLIGYYEIIDNMLVRIDKFEDGKVSISSENQIADYSSISKNKYTVAFPMIIMGSFNEDTHEYSELKIGEKIQILEITDSYFQDMKIQRENGDIVDVTTTTAGRT